MMWGLNGFWIEGTSAETASMTYGIHVLLVDHDGPHNTANLLELCQYRVTFVELASTAISILSSGKVKYDVVMANINSPDLNGFKLLQLAVNMGLPIIAMSYIDDALVAMRALESGALLFVKKPATLEVLSSLWQHVLREKARFLKQWERYQEGITSHSQTENQVAAANDDVESRKKLNARRECTDWTQELHAKFMDAVRQLGDGRCFPKEILNLMSVDGLTRLQVASHLQKCRNDNWRVEEGKTSRSSQREDRFLTNPRKFGTMPRLGRDDYPVQVQENHQIGQNADMEIAPASNDNYQYYVVPTNHQQLQLGSLQPDADNAASDDLYNFLEMNGFNQNLQQQQGSRMNNPNLGIYHFDPDQSMDARSHWSSQSSSFGK